MTTIPTSTQPPAHDSHCFISVVMVVRNDEATVDAAVSEIHAVLRTHYDYFEVVVIDDASTDSTPQCMKALLQLHEGVRFIRLSRPHGEPVALAAGVQGAIGDFVVTMSPRTDPPELIPELVDCARSGSGVVFGVRSDRRGDSLRFRVGSTIFHLVARVMGADMPPRATEFRVLSRRIVNSILSSRDGARNMRLWSASVGYGGAPFPYTQKRRCADRRRSLTAGIGYAVDTLVSASPRPLRLVSLLGVSASMLNLIYAGYVVGVYLVKDQVAEGWTTMSLQSSMMFFLLFALLAVLCEYIGHIQLLARDRPTFDLLEEQASPVNSVDDRMNVQSESL